LGGDASYPLGGGLAINAGLFYGPSPLAFSDIDRYREWYLSASFEVFENAILAAGIRSLDVELEFGNGFEIEIEDGAFVEMKLSF
ncbi:MAG: hypothetical protein JKY66_07030, partial [Spongiibacteraceae bacterium]|nr:hypothetical protein [Spongiibacteraceae bacterium]